MAERPRISQDASTLEASYDIVIIGSGISIISGIISLATRSSAERRWEAYEQLRDRLTAEEAAALAPETGFRFVGADIAGRRGGAALMLHSVF